MEQKYLERFFSQMERKLKKQEVEHYKSHQRLNLCFLALLR